MRLEAKVFADAPAVELLAHLRNAGSVNTPLIEHLRPLDAVFPAPGDTATLHRSLDDFNDARSFAPVSETMDPTCGERAFSPKGGRSSGIIHR